MRVRVVIPAYNGGELWRRVCAAIEKQSECFESVLIIDSSSSDDTCQIAEESGFQTLNIRKTEFNHGGTRNLGIEKAADADIVIFLTQDAIPEPNCIKSIISVFNDPKVAVAYGRQQPHDDASPIAVHARNFNYGVESHLLSLDDRKKYGIKTVFSSNSFSAYRTDIFRTLGGFPSNTILGEDMYFAAKAVLADYKIAYVAESSVKHSHNYSTWEEFKRYFDIGVFHHDEPWIIENFGGAGGEGKKFIFSELNFLLKRSPLSIPLACINNVFKITGYKLGKNYSRLPKSLVRKFSMHKGYWYNN
ncbi:glycosyltransferase family 2 protein [Pectobacterium carotovorum]|uniref:glycosyltransferase family 2 protein n=1 Tax=Pectobacterium carotovorum TaxID=554 RepID=UPI001E2E3B8C|nr:glycosyltransferase family A protein [Pectobacterium carotovorum]UFT95766.1 glycosyltransferase family 2 protein [Pectobacterium carotovorum]